MDSQVWMSHSDTITTIRKIFQVIGSTESIPVAALKPAILNFQCMLFNFIRSNAYYIWKDDAWCNFLKKYVEIQSIGLQNHHRQRPFIESVNLLKTNTYCSALSGGVDSSVATLLMKAVGNRLHCFYR